MLLRDLLTRIDRLAPFALAEPWDNVGLQVGSPATEVRRLLVALDVDESALDEAARLACELIVSHHPLLFTPLETLTDASPEGALLLRAARQGVALVAAHTNLDKARGGLADVVCEMLGVEAAIPLATASMDWVKLVGFVPTEAAAAVRAAVFAAGAGVIGDYVHCSFATPGEGTFRPLEGARPAVGEVGTDQSAAELRMEFVVPRALRDRVAAAFVAAHPYEEPAYDVYPLENAVATLGLGRVGYLDRPQNLSEFAATVARVFGLAHVRYAGDARRRVRRIACLPGSGAALLEVAVGACDVLVTGDVKYHEAAAAARRGLALVEVPHDVCEQAALERWSERLSDALGGEGIEVEFHRRPPLWLVSNGEPATAYPEGGAALNARDDEYHLYVDGGARGNPGPAAIGVRLVTASGEVLEELADAIGEATNNVAEYEALVAGLELALDRGIKRLAVFSDSELVVKQLSGEYRVKDAVLRGFHEQAGRLLHGFAEVRLQHIPREQNAAADRLVNEVLDRAQG